MVFRFRQRSLCLLAFGGLVLIALVCILPPAGEQDQAVVIIYDDQFVEALDNDVVRKSGRTNFGDENADSVVKANEKNAGNDIHYSVVIDVGSSGSRTFIYSWKLSEIRAGELLKIDHVRDVNGRPAITKVEPAIHDVARLDEGYFDSDFDIHNSKVESLSRTGKAEPRNEGNVKNDQTDNGVKGSFSELAEASAMLSSQRSNSSEQRPRGAVVNSLVKPVVIERVERELEAKYANLTHVEAYISRLIDYADGFVPRSRRAATSLFVLCTAGVRSLPGATQTRLLSTIRLLIKRAYSDYNFQDEHVEVLSGRQEGIYAWIAANYVLGRFDAVPASLSTNVPREQGSEVALSARPVQSNATRVHNESGGLPVVCRNGQCRYRTLSVVDMGGSSMQLAFEVNDATSGDGATSDDNETPIQHVNEPESSRHDAMSSQDVRWKREVRSRYVDKLPTDYVSEFDLGSSKSDTRYRFTLYVATFDQFGANKANERYRYWLVSQFLRNESFVLPRRSLLPVTVAKRPDFVSTVGLTDEPVLHNSRAAVTHLAKQEYQRNQSSESQPIANASANETGASPFAGDAGLQANYPVDRDSIDLHLKPLSDAEKRVADKPVSLLSLPPLPQPIDPLPTEVEAGKRKLLAVELTEIPTGTVNNWPLKTDEVAKQAPVRDELRRVAREADGANRDSASDTTTRWSRHRFGNPQNYTTTPPRLDGSLRTLTVYDPCSPVGYSDSLRIDESIDFEGLIEVRGIGDFELCLQLLAKANLLNVSCAKQDARDRTAYASASDAKGLPLERCTMNGLVQPRLNFASQEFYAFSEFFYTTYDIFNFVGRYNETNFREAASNYCSTPFGKLEERLLANEYPFGTASRLRAQCFKSAWMYAVLHHGLRFPRTTDRLTPTRYVRGGEVQWTLGAMLFKLRFFPLRTAFQEQFAAQKRVQKAETRVVSNFYALHGLDVYAPFAVLAFGVVALLALLCYTRCEATRNRFGSPPCRRSNPLIGAYRSWNKLHV